MDTDNASPKFNIGDKVKIKARHLKWHESTGTVVQNDVHARLHPYVIEFDPFDFAAFDEHELAPAPPLGVEPWRLLFRAHRNGWRLLRGNHYSDGDYFRCWHQASSDATFTLTVPKAVR